MNPGRRFDDLFNFVYDPGDARHHTDLVATVRAFLETSGSWAQCAERLRLHVNTLRYRMHRIDELTGRSLATLENRVDFFLALQPNA